MALSSIEFEKGSGNLGRVSDSQDGISGLLFYQAVPSAFASGTLRQVFSVLEAEQLGLTAEAEPVIHYHVTEFFRMFPSGSLYLAVYALPVDETNHTFSELAAFQTGADGALRQVGIHTSKPYDVSMIPALQLVVDQLEVEHMPLSVILCADISEATLTSLPDTRNQQSAGVTVNIGQDGASTGASLYLAKGFTIGTIGTALGVLARASVHESMAWVGKFNVGGSELDVPAFGNGTLVRNITTTQMNELDNRGYLFLQKHRGIGGTYFNGSWTSSANDYDTIEKNRAIDKAIRGIRAAVLPSLSAPLYVNAQSGQLSEDTVRAFRSEALRPIDAMITAGELSGGDVIINPAQNVLSDDTLRIAVELVPVGVSRKIKFTIGYTVKLSAAA